ncbi:MAG: glycoside hydrolase family 16 protein [Pseudomonadota bacterium]
MTGIMLAIVSAWGLATAAEAAAAPQWTLVWSDDFDGKRLDTASWTPEQSCWGGGNKERQCYTPRKANIEVSDGVLRLKAREERYKGRTYPKGMSGVSLRDRRMQPYTSGKVKTRGKESWLYGRFSARMKLPAGQGTWPAFWMMPEDDIYGTWPLSGEIDIMEAVNLGTPCEECPGGIEARTSAALHFGGLQPDNTYWMKKTEGTRRPAPDAEWRVYTLEWAEGVMQWFVDGELFMRLTADQWHTQSSEADGRPYAPFDQPFYLMFNYAVGGRLPEQSNGAGFEPASFPSEFHIDWVRVEQCTGDLETGKACLTQAEWNDTPDGPWEQQAR